MRASGRRPLPVHGDLGRRGGGQGAGPLRLVTALEAQLAAMAGRLESMYATARDLIASDDLDAALARITDRGPPTPCAPPSICSRCAPARRASCTSTIAATWTRRRATPPTPSSRTPASATTSRVSSPRSRRRAVITAGSWPSRPPRASSPTSASCSTSTPATPRPCSTPRPRSTMPTVARTRRARCSSSPRASPWPAPERRSRSGWPTPCRSSSTVTAWRCSSGMRATTP